MHQQVLQLLQPVPGGSCSCVSPQPASCAHVPAAEAEIRSLHLQPFALARHHFVDEQQQAPRLRRQLVERAAQHLVRQPVGRLDVVAA